jgi:8-oxo-dGTP pyrophosphatase MutT (NUDIX family)
MNTRSCQYRVTAKAIIEDEAGKILLIQEENGLWEVPGGGIEYGEDPKEALKREVYEEIGVKVSQLSDNPDYVWTQDRCKEKGYYALYLGYKTSVESFDIKCKSGECVDWAFYNKDELRKIKIHPILTNFVRIY